MQYAVRAGWDPQRGVDFFEVLDRQQQESGQSLPSWLSTHPAPADRVVRTRQLAASAQTGAALRSGEASHKGHVEGLVFGDNPRQGFFDGSTFKHPDEAFLLRFPAGWETRNTPMAVLAVDPQRQARLQLTVEDAAGASPPAYLRALATTVGAEILGVREETIGGRAAALAELRLTSDEGPTTLQLAAIGRPQTRTVFQIVGVAATSFGSWQPVFVQCMRSFAPLRERADLEVQPNRVRIVRLDRAQSLGDAAARFKDVPVPLATLALLNNVQTNATLDAGFRVKLVRGAYRASGSP